VCSLFSLKKDNVSKIKLNSILIIEIPKNHKSILASCETFQFKQSLKTLFCKKHDFNSQNGVHNIQIF
jgi:hypothetical protein